jgi:two-component system OmpR family sensor kinase
MSLRLKLLIAVIVLVFAGLAVSDVVTYTSLKRFLVQRVDQQLQAARIPMAFAINEAAQGGPGPFPDQEGRSAAQLPPGTFGEARDASGEVIGNPVRFTYGQTAFPDPDIPPPLTRPSARPRFFTTGAVGRSSIHYRVLVQGVRLQPTNEVGALIVAIPLTEFGQTLSRLVLVEILVTAIIVMGLGFLSWWLVRRELRPLEEIGVTAGAIAAGDLSQRVPERDPRTEIGQLSQSLNAMLAQIEEAFSERKASEDRLRRFLADASHELRTPLTSIRGYAELFRRGARTRHEDLAKSMQRIEDESARMGVMVEDLLLLARLDQDRPLELGRVDLAALAADAVEDTRATDGRRKITVEAPAPVLVLGDEARLRQVAANLLGNAVAHTPRGTAVTVRVRVANDEAVLEVADQGLGLTPEQAEKVFEPFYRSDPSRGRKTGGVGLGLAIVAAIAQAHHGRVEVASTPGGGATFRVLIPMNGTEPVAPDETTDF